MSNEKQVSEGHEMWRSTPGLPTKGGSFALDAELSAGKFFASNVMSSFFLFVDFHVTKSLAPMEAYTGSVESWAAVGPTMTR
jgi:hypothetical protein